MKDVIRERLLAFITENSLDDELLRWCLSIKDRCMAEQEDVRQLSNYIGFSPLTGGPKNSGGGEVALVMERPEPVASVTTPTSRTDKSPGPPSIGKIGTKTKDWIIGELKVQARVPEHFGAKFDDHLKLLWLRHEIKFDGTEYYL